MDSSRTRDRVEVEPEFLDEYGIFCSNFDSLATNLFNGPQLDQLTKAFIKKHANYIDRLHQDCVQSYGTSNEDHKCDEVMNRDLQLVTRPCEQPDLAIELTPSEWLTSLKAAGDPRQLLADLYRRASQASHLHITWSKSRLGREDDRLEPLELARRALRLAPDRFQVIYWYMISLGWYLDPLTNARERAIVARLFKETCERCIALNPNHALAHHLLGRYYFNVAKLTWLERMAAKNFMNCKLEGTYELAERSMRRAHELNANWLPTGLWMARLTMVQKRPVSETKEWIDMGLKCECLDAASELDRNELLEMRSRLKLTN